ncbi:PGF-CTERM-anchored ABC transporter substrate-binding protein [Natrononativus amylolyticus]|uniref:PGF-CTERM-anchored ABC transporter substrate-binding protein n=1 Tax=Natrononativus amylolyticus TaxID=2963434 RepID=UPI0020CF213F|nr:PGF-CTERM-anchored ABC transporter substrate-binding protein [Natrononativus amylolyticus]
MRTLLIVLVATLTALAMVAPAAAAPAGQAAVQDDATCEYPLELPDASGEEITLEDEPEAVVALYPGDARLAYDIGAEEAVVGMPIGEYTDALDAGDRTDISQDDGTTPDIETIVDLEPDVVLAADIVLTQEGLLEQLRDAGLTVYVFDTATTLDDVKENAHVAGQLTGECESAADTVDRMDERLAAIDDALEDEDRPLAFYEMGEGYTAGAGSFQHDVLTTAGVENLGERAGIEGWGQASEEVVLEEDPEWIIYPDHGAEPDLAESAQSTTAYEEDNLLGIDGNTMSQGGPSVIEVVETIVEAVHPEAHAELEAADDGSDDTSADDVDEGADDTATDADAGDDPADDAADDDSIPGFGVPVAVAAVVALLGFVVRRR